MFGSKRNNLISWTSRFRIRKSWDFLNSTVSASTAHSFAHHIKKSRQLLSSIDTFRLLLTEDEYLLIYLPFNNIQIM